MKRSHKVESLLEILFVIGLILIIPLFFAIRSLAGSQAAPTIAAPVVPTAMQDTEPLTTVAAKQPPQCTFPLAQITIAESTPEEYTFSEPQAVLTAPEGNYYGIVEWLPDNQQVLITEALRANFVIQNDNYPQQSINLFNPETGEMKVYAIRAETGYLPFWQSDLNAVVYPAVNFYQLDRKNQIAKFTRQIWVSYGNPDTAQLLDDNLTQFPATSKPDGSDIIYLSDKKIAKLDKSLRKLTSSLFDPIQWDYAKDRRSKDPVSYEMAWQPGTSLVFLYNDGAIKEGGYTFILNTDTGQICELNLGGWADQAHWSSDGRYLAFIRSVDYSFPINSSDLTILDTMTGNLVTLTTPPLETEGKHYVDGFVWAPDNRHLLVIGSISLLKDNEHQTGLYLVDFVSGQSVHVASEYESSLSSQNANLAWSPDGSKVLIRCPLPVADQLCLVSVQETGQ